MKGIKKLINYFFNGVRVLSNNRIIVIVIFAFVFLLLDKTLAYRMELSNYEGDYINIDGSYVKKDTTSIYYYDKKNNDTDISKDIAASDLVSCFNNKIDLNNVDSSIKGSIDSINNLFNESDRYFSFLYKDIYTGFTVSYNADAPIFTASSIKAPAMIYLYEMASLGKVDLSEQLVYDGRFYSGGSGLLKDKEKGTSYDIDTLISYAILASDNIAYAMLMNKYGRENVHNFWISHGTKNIFTYDTIWGETCANDASIYMTELYNFYKTNDTYGAKLMDYFKKAEWKILTNKEGVHNTANKGGWSNEYFHDIGIVFEENPYILVVMSKSGNDYSDYTYLFNKASILAGELHENYWKYKVSECNKIKQY